MALIKTVTEENTKKDLSFEEAKIIFADTTKAEDERIDALDSMIDAGDIAPVFDVLIQECMQSNDIQWQIFIDLIFSHYHKKPRKKDDFSFLTKMLQGQNVYLRNMVIKYLRENGEYAISYLKELMENADKDTRIFAINIVGDVKFEESVAMLRYFIAQEGDINAMMTAVDYMGEIGTVEDVALLEVVKKEHGGNAYVAFGVDMAIERIKGE